MSGRCVGTRIERTLQACWFGAAASLLGLAFAVTAWSQSFAPPRKAIDMPILTFVAVFLAASLMALTLIRLIRVTLRDAPNLQARLLFLVIVSGLAARLFLCASEPILEVDYNRYLWDGILTAHGFNPYAIAPADVAHLSYDDVRLELSKTAGGAFERISYPELRTIYPPVAQFAFAVAAWIAPWSLTAWRGVVILADLATLALLMTLLRTVGRPQLWSALYWWNPLVLKEIVNSAHMEAVLLPLVLAALWLAVRGRHIVAILALGLAIGTKLWPLVLLPLMLRPLLQTPARMAAAILLIAGMGAAFAIPVISAGLDGRSGFVSFASHWTTNSAIFPLLEHAVAQIFGTLIELQSPLPGRIARLLCAAVVLVYAVTMSWRPIRDPSDLLTRASAIIAALVLMSPAQFPWYVLWILPLAALRPSYGWHVAAALMPIYYSAFHFIARDAYAIYETWIVWLIWIPVWSVLALELWRGWSPVDRTGLRA